MITDLCDLLKKKVENISVREKTEIFIGTVHLQQEPVMTIMYELISGISYDDFVLTTMNFMKNYDDMLFDEPKSININETGKLPFKNKFRALHRN